MDINYRGDKEANPTTHKFYRSSRVCGVAVSVDVSGSRSELYRGTKGST